MKPAISILVLAASLVLACDDPGSEGATGMSIMAEVGKVAPQFVPEGEEDSDGTSPPPVGKGPAPSRAVDFVDDPPTAVLNVIEQFLRFTCHNADGSYDVCADYGIEVEGEYATSPYGGSSDNFMSMVSAFGMQFDEVFMYPMDVATCARFSGAAKTPQFTGSTGFLVGAGGFVPALGCVGKARYGSATADTFFAYSTDPRQAAFLTTGLGDSGRGSYLYQGYARRDQAGQSTVVAMNSPVLNLNGSSERLVFIGNLQTHRIALKWIGFGPGGATYKSVVAVGVAGITVEGPVAGAYGLRAESMNEDQIVETASFCIDNGTRAIVAAAEAPARCADPIITDWLDGVSTWDEVVAWVGLTAEDRAVIDDDWGVLLGAGLDLSAAQVPWDDSELIATIE